MTYDSRVYDLAMVFLAGHGLTQHGMETMADKLAKHLQQELEDWIIHQLPKEKEA